MFQDFDIMRFLILAVCCFIASVVDAISGGGGLISLPAYFAVGFPPHIALGTNKLSAFLSTFASAFKFWKAKKVNVEIVSKLFLFSLAGAALGAKTAVAIDTKYFKPISFAILILVFLYALKNKSMGEVNRYKGTTPKENIEAKDVKKEDLEFSGFDKEKYEIDSITLNASESNNGILQPMVSLKTKDGKIKSTTKALKLDGFKKNVQQDEQDKINKLVNKIDNVDYENKENIGAKNANDSTKIK